jgi:Ser/Thr protein kinase RdoA (MazF antagonist)
MKNKISIFVENFYPEIGTILSISSMHSLINSDTYKIIADKGSYVLHHNKYDKKKRIEKMCQILNEISESNSKVIQFLKNKNGDFSKNNYYLSKFEDGQIFSGNKKKYFDLAKKLVVLHTKLDKYSIDYLFKPNYKYYKLLKKDELLIIKNKISKIKNLTKIDSIIKKNLLLIENEITKSHTYPNNIFLKKQLIHFDLHPGNIIFENDSVKLFLDFNSMRNGFLMEDVLFCGFRFAYKIDSRPKYLYRLLKSFIKEYDDKTIVFTDSDLDFLLSRFILYRISFILKNHFISNSDLWLSDLENQLRYLKSTKKMFN